MPLKFSSPDRRSFIASSTVFALAGPALADVSPFVEIEQRSKGRLGVMVIDVASGQRRLAYRADERFPLCSTFKVLAAAAILRRVDEGKEHLDRMIPYTQADIVANAPYTGPHVGDGRMRLADICAAAIHLSDNTAGNLMLKQIGGPEGLTRWLRQIGDPTTRLDRTETSLNTAIAGDPRDTTTPAAVASTVQNLLFGKVLSGESRALLAAWMGGTQTGFAKLHAGVSKGWREGDKTGSGDNGTSNDLAVFWPPKGGPIIAAVYVTASTGTGPERDAAIADVGRLIAKDFADRD